MPTISEFFGITVRIYYDDHNPPHFHAYYGSEEALIGLENLEILSGHLPRRAKAMVIEWAIEYRKELKENWMRAERHEPLSPITPLE